MAKNWAKAFRKWEQKQAKSRARLGVVKRPIKLVCSDCGKVYRRDKWALKQAARLRCECGGPLNRGNQV